LPAPDGSVRPPNDVRRALGEDRFAIDALNRDGVLQAAGWVRGREAMARETDEVLKQAEQGRQVFRLLCASCHTIDGYLAMRPLVAGQGVRAIETTLGRLASPVDDAGRPTTWTNPALRLATWRGRHMPPFVGTPEEQHALAVQLAMLGGLAADDVRSAESAGNAGQAVFDANCAMCHGADGEWPLVKRASRPSAEFYELIGRLPSINEMMPPFEGSEDERKALADHLAQLTASHATPEGTR